MKSKDFLLRSYGYSDIGLVRSTNQDRWQGVPKHRFFILADGMGGHNGGEVAAHEAVSYMCRAIKNSPFTADQEWPLSTLSSHFKELIQKANQWVHRLGKRHHHLSGMGTTLCSVLFYRRFLIYGHVGDSRIYRLRGGVLKQLTQDHSLEEDRPISKRKTRYPLSSHKHILTRAIGTSVKVFPDVAIEPVLPGDLYLMCSDGLYNYLSEKDMTSYCQGVDPLPDMVEAMIESAKRKGGKDNITLIMIKTEEEYEPAHLSRS